MLRPKEPKNDHQRFPGEWAGWVDKLIPDFVKQRYSPKESWRNKPFSKEDARFFFRGIEELSDLFTQERPRNMPDYFRHPRFRSAYLLYFMPLQAAKFVALFAQHMPAINAALEHGRKTGTLRIVDLGAGPGTASFALLLTLLEKWKKAPDKMPPIHLLWMDTNTQAMEDGRLLLERFCEEHPEFPKLKDRITLQVENAPWWKAPRILKDEASLILMGNVLNEASDPGASHRKPQEEEIQPGPEPIPTEWKELLSVAGGGGILIVDPAARRPSQRLSRIRDLLLPELKSNTPQKSTRIWGPCLHMGQCPMAQGRDWCHFSIPTRIPGQWFRQFSQGLGSERQWLKFSYLWLSSMDYPAPAPDPAVRRVISDPLGGAKQDILLCEPGRIPRKYRSAKNRNLRRGDVVRVSTPPRH